METIVKTIRRAQASGRPPAADGAVPVRSAEVGAVMSSRPVLLSARCCVREALPRLLESAEASALVVDGEGMPVGTVSEDTCLRVLSTGAYHGRTLDGCRTVGDVMRPQPVVIDPHSDMFAVAQALLRTGHGTAAVVVDGQVLGSVSRRDLLRRFSVVDDPGCSPRDQQDCREQREGPRAWSQPGQRSDRSAAQKSP